MKRREEKKKMFFKIVFDEKEKKVCIYIYIYMCVYKFSMDFFCIFPEF